MQISKWAYNWKIFFDPDSNKPTQEALFSRKNKVQVHLNNTQLERTSYQKQLSILPDEKRNFKQHIDSVIPKINKGISVIKTFRHSLPRKSLLTIYKAFLRPLIDYKNIIYDQPQNEAFCEKLESVQ